MATWLYHRTEAPRVFETAGDVEKALSEGWADTPTAFDEQEQKVDGRKRGKRAQVGDE